MSKSTYKNLPKKKGGDFVEDREKIFVSEYLKSGNARKAAIEAKYKPSTARYAAEWLNPNSKKYKPELDKYREEQIKKMESEKTADAKEIIEFLTSVMRGEKKDPVLRLTGEGVQTIDEMDTSIKDRLKAAELLGKRYSLFSDKVDVSGIVPVIISGGDDLED